MLAPLGYVSLAKLWTEFFDCNAQGLYVDACRFYKSDLFIGQDGFGSPKEFGSPLDYIEDIFLKSIKTCDLFMSSASGVVLRTEHAFEDGTSDWFAKLSIFEATQAVKDAAEYARNGKDWFRRLGGLQFKVWPDQLASPRKWSATYPEPADDEDIQKLLRLCRYHSLPICYQRHRFVVAQLLPPWADDLIDEAFFEETVPNFLGWSFCVPERHAKTWWTKNIKNQDFRSFVHGALVATSKVGRPRKRDTALKLLNVTEN